MRIRDGGVHIGDIFGGAGAASLSVDGAGRAFGMLVRGGSVANGVGVHALGNFIGIAGFGKYGVRGDSDSSDGAGGLFRNTAGGPALVVEGLTITKVLQITGGADLSEEFDIKAAPDVEGDAPPQQVRPGSVVSIDPGNPGKLVVSGQAYDRRVAGIISGAGGVNPGMLMGQSGSIAAGSHPVALTGRVYCWADASNGPIGPGDLLTSSDVPGHAMKVTNYASAQGSIIGKAMTSLPDGKGLVLVLVTLQ